MTTNPKQIVTDIDAHMRKSGIPNRSWYVGIASDVNQRLHGDHQVPRQSHWYIHRQAPNHTAARAIEALYHQAGCRGGPGGGDESTTHVYAYVITSDTVQ